MSVPFSFWRGHALLWLAAGCLGLGVASGEEPVETKATQDVTLELVDDDDKEEAERRQKLQAVCSHRQVGVVESAGPLKMHAFAMASDGTLYVMYAPREDYGADEEDADEDTPKKRNAKPEPTREGAVHVLDAAGKLLRQWKVGFVPQSIAVTPAGDVLVGGAGRLVSFSNMGKPLTEAQSPPLRSLDRDALKQQATASLEEQREELQESVAEAKREIEKLEASEKKSRQDKQSLAISQSQLLYFEQQLKRLEKRTVDDEAASIQARLTHIHAIAATDQHVFVTTRMSKGYGFAIWRMNAALQEPSEIVRGLSGCCGQIDIQCHAGEVFVAENSRHRVTRYDRDGKLLAKFGKRSRESEGGTFGGCCNPMNVCFSRQGEVLTSESDGLVKRFSPAGEFVDVVGVANVQPGCKNSTVGLSPDGGRLYYLDSAKARLLILAKAESKLDVKAEK